MRLLPGEGCRSPRSAGGGTAAQGRGREVVAPRRLVGGRRAGGLAGAPVRRGRDGEVRSARSAGCPIRRGVPRRSRRAPRSRSRRGCAPPRSRPSGECRRAMSAAVTPAAREQCGAVRHGAAGAHRADEPDREARAPRRGRARRAARRGSGRRPRCGRRRRRHRARRGTRAGVRRSARRPPGKRSRVTSVSHTSHTVTAKPAAAATRQSAAACSPAPTMMSRGTGACESTRMSAPSIAAETTPVSRCAMAASSVASSASGRADDRCAERVLVEHATGRGPAEHDPGGDPEPCGRGLERRDHGGLGRQPVGRRRRRFRRRRARRRARRRPRIRAARSAAIRRRGRCAPARRRRLRHSRPRSIRAHVRRP